MAAADGSVLDVQRALMNIAGTDETSTDIAVALSDGVAVGNLNWTQQLIGTIGADLSVRTGLTGLLVTTVQVGYALGVFCSYRSATRSKVAG